MNNLSLVFLAALTASLLLRLWLALRQTRYVQRHRDAVPPPFNADISLADHQKAADYTAAKSRFGLLGMALDFALVLVWTLGGGLATLDDAWRGAHLGPLTSGVLVIGSFVLLNA